MKILGQTYYEKYNITYVFYAVGSLALPTRAPLYHIVDARCQTASCPHTTKTRKKPTYRDFVYNCDLNSHKFLVEVVTILCRYSINISHEAYLFHVKF